ncbi:hamartin isoform X2 [Agrilus planipennis]|uniref:Hamartin isoform X2 n=1 Tax=Agrilus planipennis TaxID=224129 RepID=A0A1W4X4V9_AGRPL|nr:hamartin isoform X2 [Agrilus planipennis]
MKMAEWFMQLDSNDPQMVEEVKQKFHEQFNIVQDSWLLNGLYDYYLNSNSARSMEILVNVKEPHHNYLFAKISDSIRGSKTDTKVQALTLLGHVLRKQPPWLFKITEHQLLRDLLKLLKTETDIVLLLSALLVLIVLLPIVPALMGQYLQDVFEIFSRLAAWNNISPIKLVEDQLVHMQVAHYALFQRLYGMYPCNFLAYLRNQYRNKDQIPIFMHTIKPMLDTVKMHPCLVTASKDKETTTDRWKCMEAHDVIVECERLSLDVSDRCSQDSCYSATTYRSRSGTINSGSGGYDSAFQFSLKNTPIASLINEQKDFFSPSLVFQPQTPPLPDSTSGNVSLNQGAGQSLVVSIGPSKEGSSPPEAAIEATPETTPIKDVRMRHTASLPQNSNVVRALNSFGTKTRSMGSSSTTPSHSQPSSPMRKETSPFNFDGRHSAFGHPKKDHAVMKVQKLMHERNVGMIDSTLESAVARKTPTSPLRFIPSVSDNNFFSNVNQRIESPISVEDEEVLEIVQQGKMENFPGLRQCDSVLQEVEGCKINEEDLEEQEHGSPCTEGGLHMADSRSMNILIKRLRYHSQCGPDRDLPEISTESSPGKFNASYPNNAVVRRANSCPEMKKSQSVPTKESISKTLLEADEEAGKDNQNDAVSLTNGLCLKEEKRQLAIAETQTENFWPMPYEHLFLGIFPLLEGNADVKISPTPSPAPYNVQQDKSSTASPYEILDRYLEVAINSNSNDRDVVRHLREQLQLLHQQLLFERHRRETHALRNRRLLADSRSIRALEEHNSALRDQIQLQQKEIDSLREELNDRMKVGYVNANLTSEAADFLTCQCATLRSELKTLTKQNDKLEWELEKIKTKCVDLNLKWQQAEEAVFDASAEARIAKEQAWAGEKDKAELEIVSRELLLSSELQMKYREKLSDIIMYKRSEYELQKLKEAYNAEIKGLNQLLETKTTNLEAYRSRMIELEQAINHSGEVLDFHKRLINQVKEEYDEMLKAVESKYQTQLTINRSLEERVLELQQRIDLSLRRGGGLVNSPDTSSCHEVHATATDRTSVATGISPHSSPLSASLASSEGSVAFAIHAGDSKEVKNLQVIMDEKEPLQQTVSTNSEEINLNEEGSSSSITQF